MAIIVDTNNTDKGTIVNVYNSMSGYDRRNEKHYLVSDDRKDEFISIIKKKEARKDIITALTAILGLFIGGIVGHKFTKNPSAQPELTIYSALTGFVLGSGVGMLYDNFLTKKILKMYNADKVL